MTAPPILPALLLSLPLVLTACRAGGAVCKRLGQPPVIGEIAAGILLGPSVLGRACPAAAAALFPPDLAPVLDSLGQLGLLCFGPPERPHSPSAPSTSSTPRGTAQPVGNS
ncbi:cation:proton antiporter domain-containing protein [Streptomyces lydicus]|uniref:cation:proton antiporter domain-containing protein n=1 Tax=Streptomyces lydicus TaxID=47763 RepID=UPI0028703840|nr:cation:proton antiporter [Streptomyces lydicus]